MKVQTNTQERERNGTKEQNNKEHGTKNTRKPPLHGSEGLCRDLLEFLANQGALENLRGMIEEHPYLFNTPSKVTREYNGKEKTYKDDSKVTISIGAASLTRPSSGRREFNGNFNAETVTGASPREVLREYMMHV